MRPAGKPWSRWDTCSDCSDRAGLHGRRGHCASWRTRRRSCKRMAWQCHEAACGTWTSCWCLVVCRRSAEKRFDIFAFLIFARSQHTWHCNEGFCGFHCLLLLAEGFSPSTAGCSVSTTISYRSLPALTCGWGSIRRDSLVLGGFFGGSWRAMWYRKALLRICRKRRSV